MVLKLSPAKYGKLLSRTMPKRIETDAEMDHFVEVMEGLSRAIARGEADPKKSRYTPCSPCSSRNTTIASIRFHKAIPYACCSSLMEQRGLRAADLTPVFGARSIASMVLNGKRELSKAHIRKLAEFFHVSPAPFLA